jgi:hypothetical protein
MRPKGGPNAVRLLKTIPSLPCPYPHSRFAVALAADEFQIAVVAQCGRRSYSLLLKNFLAAAKKTTQRNFCFVLQLLLKVASINLSL